MADLWVNQDVQELNSLRRFLQIEVQAQRTVSTTASIIFLGRPPRTHIRATVSIGDGGTRCSNSAEFEFAAKDVATMQVFQVVVACPTLTSLSIQFESDLPNLWKLILMRFNFDALETYVFSVLSTSHSLSHLTLFIGESYLRWRVETIARFLSGNTQLRSCTMTVRACKVGPFHRVGEIFVHPWWALLVPFTTTVPSEANLGIKRLVLQSIGRNNGWKARSFATAVVDLVARNTTLEILEVGPSMSKLERNSISGGMGLALRCNRTLKEIRFQLGSVADFEQLVVQALVPDANGHQANTTLSTLELSLLPSLESPLDFLTDLAKLVAFNSTLTDVRIFRNHSAGKKPLIQKTMVEVWKLRGELERITSCDETQACCF